MKLKTSLFSFLFSGIALICLTSAYPASKTAVDASHAQTAQSVVEPPVEKNTKALLKAAAEAKGSKLTIKEKLAIKLWGKKLTKKAHAAEGKSQVTALILVALVGVLGIHRFYLGYTWQGVVQLLTAGGCGVWALIDLIRIITGDLKPKNGEYSQKL